MIGSRRLGFRNFEKDADRLDTELFGAELPPGPIGTAAWNHIHLIPPGGATVTSYPVTVAGLLAALTAATVAGSMIWIPPGTFNTAITIPANIALVALGEKVSINGQWTLNSGVVVANVVQTQSGSSAGALSGVIGPSSGIAYMKNCSINVENSGAGDAYAVNQSGAGDLWLWGCATYGNASGVGSGFGVRQSAGNVYTTRDGRHRGSTGKFSGTVQLFDIDDVIHLKTSTFTKLYNATAAGVAAALTAASSGDRIEFPRRIQIAFTSGITVPAGVILVEPNLAFSGFSGQAVTLSNTSQIRDYAIDFNGTGQASATALYIYNVSGASASRGNAIAHDATTNIGTHLKGVGSNADSVNVNDIYGEGNSGTTAVGILIEDYVRSRKVIGNAYSATTNVGIRFSQTVSDAEENWFEGGTGRTTGIIGTRYGMQITGGNYGRIQNSIAIGDTAGLRIEAGGTAEVRFLQWTSLSNAGTLTCLPSDLDECAGGAGSSPFPPDPYTDDVATNRKADIKFGAQIDSVDVGGTDYQVISYWDDNDYLVIGVRIIDGDWTLYTYDGTGGLATIQLGTQDSHNYISIALDSTGVIHVAYDMHNDALLYRKSDAVVNVWTGGLTATLSMVGTNETSVTYPTFFRDPSEGLYFMFRDGIAGNGDLFFYKYNTGTATWAAATGTGTGGKIIDGKSTSVSPYWLLPVFDSDFGAGGYMHLSWFWRDTDASTNHDMNYVRWDGTTFTKTTGAQTVPITDANEETFDPVGTGNGLGDFLGRLSSDSSGNPIIPYIKNSGNYQHVYVSHHDGAAWTIQQITFTPSWQSNDPASLRQPQAFIDRTTDTVYIFYQDDRDVEGILIQVSDPGDYTKWRRYVVYPRFTGQSIALNFDSYQWWQDTEIYIGIAYYIAGETSLPIRIFKWVPGNPDPQYSDDMTHEHDHSGEGYGGQFELDNLLATGITDGYIPKASSGAIVWSAETGGSGSGVIFAPVTDGDIATPEIIFNNGEVVMNGVDH